MKEKSGENTKKWGKIKKMGRGNTKRKKGELRVWNSREIPRKLGEIPGKWENLGKQMGEMGKNGRKYRKKRWKTEKKKEGNTQKRGN